MNMRRLPFILMALATQLSLQAQTPTQQTQTLSQQDVKVVETALNRLRGTIYTAPFRVDSATMAGDTLTFYARKNVQDIPFRPDNYASLMAEIRQELPQYADKQIRIMALGQDIHNLIPQYLLPVKERRAPFRYEPYLPLVKNENRPFQIAKGLDGRNIAMWQSHGAYYEQGLRRWEWQRARMFETVEDKYTQSYVVQYLIPMLENAGANVLTPRERDLSPVEVVVDNDGGLATSPYKEVNGKEPWTTGEGAGFAYKRAVYRDFENPFKEGTYRMTPSTTKAAGAGKITWTPTLPETRTYAVYVAYKTLPNSTATARYTVHHQGQTTTFIVNQRMGGGTWIYLGTFRFGKGTNDGVELTSCTGHQGEVVTADAVRFGGGMGNIARAANGDSITPNSKTKRDVAKQPRNAFQPRLDIPYETSGYPRFEEGARYWLQWAGVPDSVYSPSNGKDDYADDYKCRGAWVNYLVGGTKAWPEGRGLGIPVDASLAFHSDAGTVYGDTIIGTLGIYHTFGYDGKFADGTSRDACRDLCDRVVSSVVNDVRALYEPQWTRRGMWNSSYFEARLPRVPAMLIELLSHENFADMRYGLNPRFQFTVARAVYKGFLKFIASEYNQPCVVQPLPVSHFSALWDQKKQKVRLSWQSTDDPLEPTAKADRYVVYTRVGDADWDNGTVVKAAHTDMMIPTGKVVSFKVCALNAGGQSFPSEILAVGIAPTDTLRPVLIVNGFDRISAPDDFVSVDDEEAGMLADQDNGVPYREMITYTGKMKEFRRSIPWMDDDASGYGDSYGNYERIVVAGNTFDYPALHGASLLKAGHSFMSVSKAAFEADSTLLTPSRFAMLDLILGKEKQCKMGRLGALQPLAFKTFTEPMQKAISRYCQDGGRVLVSGSYVASDLWCNRLVKASKDDQAFAENILKYKWRNERASVTGGLRSVASPMECSVKTFYYYNEPNPEGYVVESPDAIEPADDCAYTAFRYTENGLSAGVVFGGTDQSPWRTVVLGFPLESVKGSATRDLLMKDILRYLLTK